MNSNEQAVDVWQVDLDACPYADRFEWLPDDDRLRVTRMGTAKLRDRMSATRMSLRLILAEYLSMKPSEIVIKLTALGQPFLERNDEFPCPHVWFNLTHAEGRMLVAVSRHCEVGIDLEYVHRRVDPEKLAPMVLTQAEQIWLDAQPDRLIAFLSIWTAKEAALKLWGTGLQIPAKQIALDWTALTASVSPDSKYFPGEQCSLCNVEASGDWLAHLATRLPQVSIRTNAFQWT